MRGVRTGRIRRFGFGCSVAAVLGGCAVAAVQAQSRPLPTALPTHSALAPRQADAVESSPLLGPSPNRIERLPSNPALPAATPGETTGPFADLRTSIAGLSKVAPYPVDESYVDWTPQRLPSGLIYRSYLAGVKESRIGSTFDHMENYGWLWDITLGGRVGLFRFGSSDPVRPEGFQIDLEGAGMPRLDLENNEDLLAADFRAGMPITYGIGRWQSKLAYYHLSSHLGDEFMLRNPTFRRVNYSRDALVLGQSFYVTDDLRLYAEADWAFVSDVSQPWQFQFGTDFSPFAAYGSGGAPFAAVNGQIRQEQNFSGNLVVQAGWQWQAEGRPGLLRIGMQYYNGKSNQYQLFDRFEQKLGLGLWYDY